MSKLRRKNLTQKKNVCQVVGHRKKITPLLQSGGHFLTKKSVN